jgi:hypothetical protein
MIKIYRMTDRIPIKIGPVEFLIGPLSYQQKQEILSQGQMKEGDFVANEMSMAALAIKYQVKEIKGVKDLEGTEYKVEMNGNGLTDNCVSEILQLENSALLIAALANMLNGIKDPKIKGVEVRLPKAKNAKRQA